MKILIFGCGRTSKDFLGIISNDVNLIGFSDNNQALHKTQFAGKLVYPPKEIMELDFDYIVVASMHYNEIIKQLTEAIGVLREKILVFIGSRCPESAGNDNDIKLKKLLRKSSPNKIGFSLSDIKEENHDLQQLYKAIPTHILDKYEVECFNHKDKTNCGIVIHQDLKCMPNYLTATNIALWKGLSFKEISQIRDMPSNYILEGAYIHGVNYILLKGDYIKRLPCISWDITANKLNIVGIPTKITESKISIENRSRHNFPNRLIYIPSALYKSNSETLIMDCGYTKPYIKEIFNKSKKLKSIGLDVVIALPSSDISSLEVEPTTNVRFVTVESNKFYNTLANADIVVTDTSISNLGYMLFANKLLHLIPNTPDYVSPKKYGLKGHDHSPIAHCVRSVDEMLDLAKKLLESGDEYACKRELIRDKLSFDSNNVLSERLWDEIGDFL